MNDRRKFLQHLGAASVAGLCSSTLRADDWPQWRGTNRDGVWKETGLLEKLPDGQLPIKWQMPIGPGYSGPTVSQGLVLITDRVVEPSQAERIWCFDETTGEVKWTYQYPCEYKISYEAGPRAAVTIDGEQAFALGAMGHLHALDLKSGKLLWARDLNTDYDIQMPIWGITAAPLVRGDAVLLHIGGEGAACAIAVNRQTGKDMWRALSDRAGYSSPVIIRQADREVAVFWTGDSVAGLDPQIGTVYWRYPFPPRNMPIGVPTPVVNGDRVFVSSFYDGSLMLRVPEDSLTVEEIWKIAGKNEQNTSALHCMISTPIFREKHIYGVDSYGQLRCLDAQTGERIWEDRTATPQERWSNIHMIENEDRVWMFNEAGQLLIGQLSPEGFTELSRCELIKPTRAQLSRSRGRGVCWSHPALANRCIFARNDESIVCADLSQKT